MLNYFVAVLQELWLWRQWLQPMPVQPQPHLQAQPEAEVPH
jgi:hypothetical protein